MTLTLRCRAWLASLAFCLAFWAGVIAAIAQGLR
jgi:hypothetical protein